MRQLSTRISLIQFNEFVTEDADLHHLVKCQCSQEWYSVQIVVLSYIKFNVKIGRTIKNTWFVPNIEKEEKTPCTSHQIKNVDIEASLLYSIQQVTAFAKKHEAEFVELVTKANTQAAEREIRESKKEYEQATARISKLDSFIQKLFEDNAEGKISDERFTKMTATYEAEQRDLQERVKVLEAIIADAKEKTANVDSFLEIVHRYTDIQELDAEIIRTFIEKVYVYQNEKLWSRDTKKLKIVFNFIGDIQIPRKEKTEQPIFHDYADSFNSQKIPQFGYLKLVRFFMTLDKQFYRHRWYI